MICKQRWVGGLLLGLLTGALLQLDLAGTVLAQTANQDLLSCIDALTERGIDPDLAYEECKDGGEPLSEEPLDSVNESAHSAGELPFGELEPFEEKSCLNRKTAYCSVVGDRGAWSVHIESSTTQACRDAEKALLRAGQQLVGRSADCFSWLLSETFKITCLDGFTTTVYGSSHTRDNRTVFDKAYEQMEGRSGCLLELEE